MRGAARLKCLDLGVGLVDKRQAGYERVDFLAGGRRARFVVGDGAPV